MRYMVLSCLLLATPAHAQDRLATSVFLGGAIADDVTTWRNMRGGFTEADPLYAFANDKPAAVILSLAVTDAVTLWLSHRYATRHPRLVKIALFTLGGVRMGQSIHNVRAWNAYQARPIFIPDPH